MNEDPAASSLSPLPKAPTGIAGLDDITGGGLPRGRPTVVYGGPGCGKTLLAATFLVAGARDYGEPGVFVSFEESAAELAANVAALGWDLAALQERNLLALEHIDLEPHRIVETGTYDLEGLFIRLDHLVSRTGAKRLALDTLESLFGAFRNQAILRGELRRLFRWLKERRLTSVVTAELSNGSHRLEEYVSDCVIHLEHTVAEENATRQLRVVKYRGSNHGTNLYPFFIGVGGIEVFPITAVTLDYPAATGRLSSGIPDLDAMLGGEGYYRGASILVSGTAGTGKTTVAAHFIAAACSRGERAVYFAFEESASQIIRDMRSVGLDLHPWVEQGLLRFRAVRPTQYGLERQFEAMRRVIAEFNPQVAVIDPISNLIMAGGDTQVKCMLMRLIDFLKQEQITSLFTDLTIGGTPLEATDSRVSSLMDTWILLRDIEEDGERNRGLYVLKSRGMAHSNQVREFRLTDGGIKLIPPYLGPGGVRTGAARLLQEAEDEAMARKRRQEAERLQAALERKRKLIKAQMESLEAELDAAEDELRQRLAAIQEEEELEERRRQNLSRRRGG